MKKETFYFSHDYEPTSDPKIQALIGEFGASGYGIYWRIIEMLHSNTEHKLPLKEYLFLAIAKQMLTSAEQTQAIINYCILPCELFVSDNDFFWSNRVNNNFLLRLQLSEKRSVAGRAGAIAKQKLAKPGKEKKRKEKESKEIEDNREYTYNSFFDEQIKANENENPDLLSKYKQFVDFLFGKTEIHPAPLTNVLSLTHQCTFKEYVSLLKWIQDNNVNIKVSAILLDMENKPTLKKQYSNVALTIRGWMRFQKSNNKNQSK